MTPKIHDKLSLLVSAGLIPTIRAEIFKYENQRKTVDEIAAEIRLLVDAYDEFFQTGRKPH